VLPTTQGNKKKLYAGFTVSQQEEQLRLEKKTWENPEKHNCKYEMLRIQTQKKTEHPLPYHNRCSLLRTSRGFK
jgi:hypothetical protein